MGSMYLDWIGMVCKAATSPRERGPRAYIESYLTSGTRAKGIHRKLPHLGNAGKGLNRQLPHLGNAGKGIQASDLTSGTRRGQIVDYMRQLAERMRKVRVCCGDWQRVCGPSVTVKHGITGVFLDPPYADEAERTGGAVHRGQRTSGARRA